MIFRSLNSLSICLVFAAGCKPGDAPPPPPFQYDTLTSDQVFTFDGVNLGGSPAVILEGTEHTISVSMRILDPRLRAENVKWRFDLIGSNLNKGRVAVGYAPATLKPDPDRPGYVAIEGVLPIMVIDREFYEIKLQVDTGNERFHLGSWPVTAGPSAEWQPEPSPVVDDAPPL